MPEPRKNRSPTRLAGVTALILNGKWAIKPAELKEIIGGFTAYLDGKVQADGMLEQARASRERKAAEADAAQEQAPGVALLTMYGTIFPRGSMLVDLCGAFDSHTFASRIRQAADDPSIASIVIDVDSGGGAVAGVDVAAEAVRYAASQKRVTAVCNTMMCSAALWISSGATEIVVTPAGEIGSIGVIGTHTDQTALLDEEGLKVTYVRSTERKALGQPAEAMEGAALDQWQSEIDRLHELFTAEVATGRAVTVGVARKWATGDVWFGQDAVDTGLADSVGTLTSVLQDHLQAAQQAKPPTVRTGKQPGADAPSREPHMKIEVKDRNGKVHVIDTEAATAQADAQNILNAIESGAYSAGIDAQKQVVATALGIEPNDVTPDALAATRAHAHNGQAYRADLEQQAEQLAVSVYGAETPGVGTATRLAKSADLEGLKGLVADLQARKALTVPGGRLSAEDEGSTQDPQADKPKATVKTPARAYDF